MGLRLTGERLEEIKERVVSMYERFDINCVPISSFELATKMGIKVIPYSAYNERVQAIMLKESEDGYNVERVEGEFYIFYNDKKTTVESTIPLCMKLVILF